MKKTSSNADKYREIMVLSIVPCAVGILTIVSWIMAHWEIGPGFLNAGLALFATLFSDCRVHYGSCRCFGNLYS
jgi:hypothetical protein